MIILKNVKHDKNAESQLMQILKHAGVHCEFVQEGGAVAGGVVHIQIESTPRRKSSSLAVQGNHHESSSMTLSAVQVDRLKFELQKKNKEIKELEENLSVALDSIKTFHRQQNELYEEFIALRDKYDGNKRKLRNLLWKYIPNTVDGFDNIPRLDPSLEETEDQVGEWKTGAILGEGQFAVVKEVISGPVGILSTFGDKNDKNKCAKLAVKRILKDKIQDVKNTRRVNNEIRILRDISHPNIVNLIDICHTELYIYLIQERGGLDLFEHYRKNPGPAKEAFARTVIKQIASAVAYLSRCNIVHRDLKPENILIGPENSVKLVDFGLSTHHQKEMTLDDFCGTPGFFAPEMLTQKSYDTEKLDVWSLGCVFLEILLGHYRFAEIWMPAYAYENLHDCRIFERELDVCLRAVYEIYGRGKSSKPMKNQLSSSINDMEEESKAAEGGGGNKKPSSPKNPSSFSGHHHKATCEKSFHEQRNRSDDCKDFILNMLIKNPAQRISCEEMGRHPYVSDEIRQHPNATFLATPSNSSSSIRTTTSEKQEHQQHQDQQSSSPLFNRRTFTNNSKPIPGHLSVVTCSSTPMSPTSPKTPFQHSNKDEDAGRTRLLPPLSPASPNVEGVANIVKLGDALMSKHDLK